jgi:dihydrofolate reductase
MFVLHPIVLLKMTISFIVAVSENGVIGNKGQLPWSLPADLKYFKNTTWALPVIMGRKTFESFPKALQGRTNIVVTRELGYKANNILVENSIDKAIAAAATLQTAEVFIIGGSEIFQQSWDKASRMYITRVHATVEGDAFFPQINEQEWRKVSSKDFTKDHKHIYDYSFEIWERKAHSL